MPSDEESSINFSFFCLAQQSSDIDALSTDPRNGPQLKASVKLDV